MKDWVTLVGAVVASVTGVLTLWRSYRSESDSIMVRWGSFRPLATQTTDMYVVNLGKHPVQLSDYGFINEDGSLFSIPWYNQTEYHPDHAHPDDYYGGSALIPPRDMFAIGMVYRDETVGVYAYTATQTIPRISMKKSLFRPLTLFMVLRIKFVRAFLI
jgi:hypothetical protein